MKIILIAGCTTCPHGAQWNLDHTEYMCDQLTKINKNPKRPLSDCPLDDAVETIKKLTERI